jgi:broad specificity phosphatase PhoE
MRWLEVRRHSVTKKGPARGRRSQLSAQGVALARAVDAELGPIAYVLTSAAPRTIETAVAMGVAADDTVDLPSGYVNPRATPDGASTASKAATTVLVSVVLG